MRTLTIRAWNTDEHAAAWLGGLWDGEGTIALYRPKSRSQPNRVMRVFNTDTDIMDTAEAAIQMLDMDYRRYTVVTDKADGRGRTKDIEVIEICRRRSFEVFRAMVPLGSTRKSDALDAILASYSTDVRYRRPGVVCGRGHEGAETVVYAGVQRCRACINEDQRARYWAAKGDPKAAALACDPEAVSAYIGENGGDTDDTDADYSGMDHG